jgi:hypothetical protein
MHLNKNINEMLVKNDYRNAVLKRLAKYEVMQTAVHWCLASSLCIR